MGSRIECFWIEPSGRTRLFLRRYAGDEPCPGGYSYHNAMADFGEHPTRKTPDGYLDSYADLAPPADDPRWPVKCGECGYQFKESDNRQVFQDEVFKRSDGGPDTTLRKAPAGAMWDGWWHPEKGPDGIALFVMTPGGEWFVDGPATNGGGWTRQGTVPKVTARPSILIKSGYHGFLTDGFLEEC